VLDLYDYWSETPCVRDMVAAYLGIEGRKPEPEITPDSDSPYAQDFSPEFYGHIAATGGHKPVRLVLDA